MSKLTKQAAMAIRVSIKTWSVELKARFLLCVALCGFAVFPSVADTELGESIKRLKELSFDELLEVSLVTKTPEKVATTPAAVDVIRGEDIRRSGATSLPEALRLAPSLEVARVNSRDWAISARGFNNTLANKLLVMIDGRLVYTPLYAGVFYDAQSVLLEDIDRIDVVTGPGGTLWGANAVNGIINVVTKSSRDTQGLYLSGAGGSLLQDFGAARYGGKVGKNLYYRVYGQHFDRGRTELSNGMNAPDRWNLTQGGFRADWYPSELNSFTLQGDIYGGDQERAVKDAYIDGENVVARWNHSFGDDSDLQVQMYYDRTWRNIRGTFAEELHTYDTDIQHRFGWGDRNTLVWGFGYRLYQDRVRNGPAQAFLPPTRNLQVFSGFLQDEITLVPDRLRLIIGTKLEHNDYSQFEVQPSARLAWTPDEIQTFWAAITRAVRSPSRIDTDYYTPPPPVAPGTPHLAGGPNFDSEKVVSYELGYRVRPMQGLSLSLATYYNFYDDLRSVDEPVPNTFVLDNHFRGELWGVELGFLWRVTDRWRVGGGYNYLHKHLYPHGGDNVNASVREGNDPDHFLSFQSILDLPGNFQFDVLGRYVDRLPVPSVPSYVTFDARIGWRFKGLELALVGQNLAEARHAEFGTQRIPRSFYGKVSWRF